jgi:hypothetical protein
MKIPALILPGLILAACAADPGPPTAQPIVTVWASPSASPWFAKLFECAAARGIALDVSPQDPQIELRLGEPAPTSGPAYEVGQEQVMVVAGRASALPQLSSGEARALFAGRGDPAVQIWVFSSGMDVQQAFDRLVMDGAPVSSFARLALDPQQMVEEMKADPNAAGILPRSWMTEDLRSLQDAGSVPVLAATRRDAREQVLELIACMQAN